jgi:Resolvase, N terminal domain
VLKIYVAVLDFFATPLCNHANRLRPRLDRLSRSLRDVLEIMDRVQEKKAGFRSLTEAIDTTTRLLQRQLAA